MDLDQYNLRISIIMNIFNKAHTSLSVHILKPINDPK